MEWWRILRLMGLIRIYVQKMPEDEGGKGYSGFTLNGPRWGQV